MTNSFEHSNKIPHEPSTLHSQRSEVSSTDVHRFTVSLEDNIIQLMEAYVANNSVNLAGAKTQMLEEISAAKDFYAKRLHSFNLGHHTYDPSSLISTDGKRPAIGELICKINNQSRRLSTTASEIQKKAFTMDIYCNLIRLEVLIQQEANIEN